MIKENQVFYKSRSVVWRRENDKELIVRYNDTFLHLNETASLIFHYCEGMNLIQIAECLRQYGIPDSKNLTEAISGFLKTLLKEKLITTELHRNIISGDYFLQKQEYTHTDFITPKLNIFRIGCTNYSRFTRPAAPLRIFLTLTYDCNLQCKTCYNDSLAHMSPRASTDTVIRIINKIKISGVLEVILTGGEPFSRPDIFQIIDYILLNGISLRVNTNGLLLTDDYITELKKRKVVIITLGLDGVSEKTHDTIRGKGNFKKVVAIMKKLSAADINLYVNFTVTHRNFFELFKLKKFLKGFHVSRIIINVFISSGKGYAYRTTFALRKVEYALILFSRLFNFAVSKPDMIIVTSCYAGYIEANIDTSGSFFFCELLKKPLGNVLEKDIKAIWNSRKLLKLMDADTFGTPCGKCFFRKSCRGVCRAEVFSATGDMYAGNPYCIRVKAVNWFVKTLLR